MAGKLQNVSITFDEKNQIRILEADQFAKTESLAEECNTFTNKIGKFEKTIGSLVEILTSQADKIEKQKLAAIGVRNQTESEPENRKRKQLELQAEIQQKKAEIERYL